MIGLDRLFLRTLMKYSLTILLLLATIVLQAQFFNKVNWEDNRHQLEVGSGTSNFLGDLGGKDARGTNDLQDLEPSEYNFGAFIGYKYTIFPKFYGRVNFTYARVSGSDELTAEAFRRNRNLHFRSNIWELSMLAEYEIPINFRKGHIHDLRGVKGWKNGGSSLFVFVGIGAFHFNPQAQLDGTWYYLHPLRTEGQGLPNGPEEYRRVALSVPFGGSFTKRLSPQFSLGFELSYRFTSTDYIDDVSTEYYNPYDIALFNDENPEVAAYFSNPALGVAEEGQPNYVTAPGQQRGDPENDDGWMIFTVKGQYLLGNGYRSPRSQFRRYRAKPLKRRK